MPYSVIEHSGHTWALDERDPPHVIKDGDDNGVAIQGEEALWAEVVSLREQLRGAVEAERHRNAALVRALAANSWEPSIEATLHEVARQIAASGGQ